MVKQYLKAVTAEQLQARAIPRQATPLFVTKLSLLPHLIEKQLLSPSTSATQLFMLARDQAFFETLFLSRDRGSDLAQFKTAEIARFSADDGLLFNHV